MSSRESERNLGLKIEFVELSGVDITPSVVGIQTFEGIRDGLIEMDVILNDSKSLIHEIDMRKLNTIDVGFIETVGSEDDEPESFVLSLVVNSIETYGRNLESNTDAFVMKCLNRSAIINERICISRSYKNVTISTVVEKMLDALRYEGERDIETTSFSTDFIVPRICPLDVVSWLLKHAVSNNTNTGDYVFYEDIDGIHFKPFNRFTDGQEPVRKYRIVSPGLPTTESDFDINTDQIRIHKVQDIFDDLENDSEQISVYEFDVERGVQKIVTVPDRKSMIDSDNTYDLELKNTFDKVITVYNTGFYESVKKQAKPKFAKALLNKSRIQRSEASIELPGENAIKPGALIELEQFNDVVEELNPVYSGIWLVDRIKRIITSKGYVIHAEIITDRIIEGSS